MARKIKHKRGPKSKLPQLDVSELAFTTDTKETFIGSNEGNIRLMDEKDLSLVTEQLAQTVRQEANELHVGTNQKYKTINEALTAWRNEYNKEFVIIRVHQGEYKEKILLNDDDAHLSIIGYDKDNTRIYWDAYTYGEPPLWILADGHNIYIANLTFESVKATPIEGDNGAYAVHIDRNETSTSVYKQSNIVMENCRMISANNVGAGIGTENDQTITFINCECISSRGMGLLYHTSNFPASNQKMRLINTIMKSTNTRALSYENVTGSMTESEIEFINCTLINNAGDSRLSIIRNMPLSPNSHGNNNDMLNANQYTQDALDCNTLNSGIVSVDTGKGGLNTPSTGYYLVQTISYSPTNKIQYAWAFNTAGTPKYKRSCSFGTWSSWVDSDGQGVALTTNTGNTIVLTDFNLAKKTGFFRVDGSTGLNTPTQSVYIGVTISYSNTNYILQYAWDIFDKYKKYKRSFAFDNWTPWQEDNGVTSDTGDAVILTDFNTATRTGFYRVDGSTTGLNTPTASIYLGQTISFTQTNYILQYAWDILNGFKKYKRTYVGTTWSAWVEIAEP
jgi:hypothetical protein